MIYGKKIFAPWDNHIYCTLCTWFSAEKKKVVISTPQLDSSLCTQHIPLNTFTLAYLISFFVVIVSIELVFYSSCHLPSSSQTYTILFCFHKMTCIVECGKFRWIFVGRSFLDFCVVALNHKAHFSSLDTHRHSPLSTHNLFNFLPKRRKSTKERRLQLLCNENTIFLLLLLLL